MSITGIVATPTSATPTTITATSSGTAQTVATLTSGTTYNVRFTGANNTGSDAQKCYISTDSGATFKYKIVDDGEESLLRDIAFTTTSETTCKSYAQASGFVVDPLIFEVDTI